MLVFSISREVGGGEEDGREEKEDIACILAPKRLWM
jgi:hypothetical protein